MFKRLVWGKDNEFASASLRRGAKIKTIGCLPFQKCGFIFVDLRRFINLLNILSMKNFLMALFLALPMMCVFTACGDDEELSGELTAEQLAMLQGSWDVTDIKGVDLPGERRINISGDRLEIEQKLPGDEDFEEMETYTFTCSGVTLLLVSIYTDELEAKVKILSLSASAANVEVEDLAYGFGKYRMNLKKR